MVMNKKNFKKIVVSYIKFWVVGIICFWLLMIMVSSIPNEKIMNNTEAAIEGLTHENDLNPEYFFGTDACTADDFSDRAMYRRAKQAGEPGNAWEGAMVPGYTRYWHGYLTYLRPLSLFFGFEQIRYIHMFLFNILLTIVLVKLKENMGWGVSICLLLSFTMVYMILAPVSFQFYTCFMLTLIGILGVLYFEKKSQITMTKWFLLLGMLTNFLDYLTFPIMTLGIPLIVLLLLKIRKQSLPGSVWRVFFFNTLLWSIGYIFTWVSKWVLAALVLKTDVYYEVVSKIIERTVGGGEENVQRLEMYKLNIKTLFLASEKKGIILFLLFVLLVGIVVYLVFRKKHPRKFGVYLPVLCVGLFPYIWYGILVEHSQMHYWFTYRAQAVTIFGILVIYTDMLQKKNLREIWMGLKNGTENNK